ncbi:MMPL family transporter [Lysobacter korlensis]|uniref:MMPL family transporter n=1 Tax=Lysobacter korlensis TaxID=553636 RepID=A0ABV6RV69_9GAMM
MLERLGRAAARHPLRTIAAWLLVCGFCGALVFGAFGTDIFARLTSDAFSISGEATEADELLDDSAGDTVTLLVHGVDPASTELSGLIEGIAEELEPLAVEVANPLAVQLPPGVAAPPELAALSADDGRGMLLVASSADDADLERATEILQDGARDIRDELGVTAEVGSRQLLVDSLTEISESDLARGEAVALPIALAVMLLVFGGFLAAGLPLAAAMASMLGGLGALYGFSYLMDISTNVLNVVTVVGLGLSIDYGLLIVSRFREEYRAALETVPAEERRRQTRIDAIGRTAATAGRTVLFSGVTFGVAALGLVVLEPGIIRAIAVGAASVTMLGVALALTLVPAVLALIGDRLIRPGLLTRLPGLGRVLGRLGDVAPEEGLFSRLARRVQRRPAVVTMLCAALLVLLGSALPNLRLANTSADAIPPSSTQHTFLTELREEFPSAAQPRVALVSDGTESQAREWAAEVEGLDPVRSVADPVERNGLWVSDVGVEDKRGGDAVRQIREDRPEMRNWVTGVDAHTADFADSLLAGSGWVALIVILGTVVLLFLMTGSIIIPLKALVVSALSLGASIGVLVWGFEQGNLGWLLGFDPADVAGVDVLVITLVLVFGFGLAMDYEMFILSRIKEQADAGVPSREAIATGLQRSGRIITSAALIIVVVFAGFATGELMIIKQLGTALAVAVFLDATLVRCLLVPAVMTWQERVMWWAPAPLRRLHARFGISD